MAYRPFGARGTEPTEINLTPLIDVSLVLVVMLLLATPLAFESSIAVRRGDNAAKQTQSRDDDAARIEIVVHDAERLSVNDLEVRLSALGRILEPLLDDAPTAPVIVRCDSGVSHGTFVEVIDEAKASGAVSIAVSPGAVRSASAATRSATKRG